MKVWEQFLQQQEEELGKETVLKWLRTLKIQRFDACNLYLEAKDSFQLLWFEEHVRGKAQASLLNGNNKKIKIHLSIANIPEVPKKSSKKSASDYHAFNVPFQLTFDEPDPFCTFDHFVESEENILTTKLLHEISAPSIDGKTAPVTFNPIYIHGSTGSGKTHLLMSLVQTYRRQGLKTIYARAETFTNHVVTAIRAGQMSTFRQAYRNADVLVIDDVHVFSRKGVTQEEFFHTFNTLHLEGKQIILSANCSPQGLQLIEPRLVSRFEWGIVLSLKALHDQELRALLKKKAESLNFFLPAKVVDYLLETFKSNPKALVKSFEALVLRLHVGKDDSLRNLTVPAAQVLLADLFAEEQKLALNPEKIIDAVAEHYGIRVEDLLGKAQTKEYALPRQIAMHFCRHQLKIPFMKIGEIFFRDHSTVMASVKYIQKALDEDRKEIASACYGILKKLE